MRPGLAFLCTLFFFNVLGQAPGNPENNWVDSVFSSLTPDQRIAQLMVVRLSSIDLKTKQVTFFDQQVNELVQKYGVGGVCVFQGGPVKQAAILNTMQSLARVPVMVCIDAEWGVGMRLLDSVMALPKQMMLGAMRDPSIVYEYGKLVAAQCKRLGIQVNYAPVIDVNNNPNNPVINDRSFGEDKFKVADFGIQYMKGLQDNGVMASAKHFPGHGDVSVDSHVDLPVIHKSIAQLDTLELYPFRQLFSAGVASTMVAHLYIPAIDSTANRATSLSKNNVAGLLRKQLKFDGITFTDALDMQGVKKFFPAGEAAVQALIAGNDMLCLPEDVPAAIQKINAAIAENKLSREEIDLKCKKVLQAKYRYVLSKPGPVALQNLQPDLNRGIAEMRSRVAENAITLLADKDSSFFPLEPGRHRVAYVGIGLKTNNAFADSLSSYYGATIFPFSYEMKNADSITMLVDSVTRNFTRVIIGIHNTNRPPLNNFGISNEAVDLVNRLQQRSRCISFVFANPYAVKNWCMARNLVVCYEDDSIVQQVAFRLLKGESKYKGVLPVTVCDNLKYGSGISYAKAELQHSSPLSLGFDPLKLEAIDSVVNDAIGQKAIPGCIVLVAREGKIVFERAYGVDGYIEPRPVTANTVYDLASLTKIAATTIAVMKLCDEKKIDLKKKIGDYIPWLAGSNKAGLLIRDLLLHEAGLPAVLPFHKTTLDARGFPLPALYRDHPSDSFPTRVASRLFLAGYWKDSLRQMLLRSTVTPGVYKYSDLDFILLGEVVENISGMPLGKYVDSVFYCPMGLKSMGFQPWNHIPLENIAPTQIETTFRGQLLRADVHDPAAAVFGEVAGHAGLFSNAKDLAAIMQMLLNKGMYNGHRYLTDSTVNSFTSWQTELSRRGYGFDKPEKKPVEKQEPYPTRSAAAETFGHTGFTGTCAWADPVNDLIYIFLSNRVHPVGSDLFLRLNVRPKIHEIIYDALGKKRA